MHSRMWRHPEKTIWIQTNALKQVIWDVMVNMSILLALNEKKNAENIIIVLPKAEDKSVSGSASFRS